MQPDEGDPRAEDHVHAGYRDFGLTGSTRALCTCGHATRPLGSSDAALRSLLDDHGARLRRRGAGAGLPY